VRRLDVTGSMVHGGPHSDFPVLVALTETWLRGISAGGEVANASGYDIYFSSDEAGNMRLAHEVELYQPDAGQLITWVKVPTLSSTTAFYIHDGDPAITASQQDPPGVWSAGYGGVWHLSMFDDATGNSTAVSNDNSSSADGVIVGSRAFDGVSGAITVNATSSTNDNFATGGTVEAWFYALDAGGGSRGRVFDKGGTLLGFCDGNPGFSDSIMFGQNFLPQYGTWCTPSGTITLNQWTHVAVTYDASTNANVPIVYLNGSAQTVSNVDMPSMTTASNASDALYIGNRLGADRTFHGQLDELRLSRVVRDAGWIATAYEDEHTPATFLTVAP
jgi:hypothetical protein